MTKKDRIRNELIRGTTRVLQVSKKITEKALEWYGRVMRRKELLRIVIRVEIPGKRRRGGQTYSV